MTQLLCQGLYVEGNKQFFLLRAALGEHPLCWTIGIHDQGFLHAPEALQQEFDAESQESLLESKQDDPNQQQSQKAVEGMDRQFAIRPVRRRPPQSGTPAL